MSLGKAYSFDSKANSAYIGKKPVKTLTKADAEKLVRKHLKLDSKPAIYVEYDHNEGAEYLIHVYEVVIDDPNTGEGHTATWGWYYVNPKTGGIRSMF
ncbi:hypothetical protein SD71_15265 [Cohnella kolymensis]|uniref:PepSY domain-containing protein n=1 Tax=Cohnella kolymensis TaxID=1590652 RepID=A0ABR5A1V9_9BACL|nr:hypothetical protein [Cohnella kolymensis]KIL35029.1 hypothetical protein SD71_15265 [Cohnella kolymensis]